MSNKFKQISIKPGFMKYNGGLFYKQVSENKSEFKVKVKKNHLNSLGITHGGFIALIIDSGAGTGAFRVADGGPCVTVSLDIKFIGATRLGDEIRGFTKIQKKTKNMIFLICHLESNGKMVASASGIWKILKK